MADRKKACHTAAVDRPQKWCRCIMIQDVPYFSVLAYQRYFLNEKSKVTTLCTTLKVVAHSSACRCIYRKYQVWSLDLCVVDVFAKEQFQYELCCFISTWQKEHISTHWLSAIAYSDFETKSGGPPFWTEKKIKGSSAFKDRKAQIVRKKEGKISLSTQDS